MSASQLLRKCLAFARQALIASAIVLTLTLLLLIAHSKELYVSMAPGEGVTIQFDSHTIELDRNMLTEHLMVRR